MHETRYLLAFLRGDNATMQEQLAWATGKANVEDWLLSAASDTEAYYGSLTEARQLSAEAVQSSLAEAPEAAAEWRANEALREAELGNADRARQKTAEALALSNGQDVRVKAALALARAGDAAHPTSWPTS